MCEVTNSTLFGRSPGPDLCDDTQVGKIACRERTGSVVCSRTQNGKDLGYTGMAAKKKPDESGSAIVMVVVVLAVLLLVATVFILAVQLESAGRQASINHYRAKLAALNALNYTYSCLYETHTAREQAGKGANTPFYDSPDEFLIDFHKLAEELRQLHPGDSPEDAGRWNITNPRGEMWFALVQDEQGKINVADINALIRENLAKYLAPLADKRDFLTRYSYRPKNSPAPLNVNTADKPVLLAILTGLSLRGSDDEVVEEEARELVEKIVDNRLLQGFADFVKVVGKCKSLSTEDRKAVLLNAQEGKSDALDSATVPFCYRSFDVFTIIATGIVNSSSGAQLAKHEIREIVSLQPPQALSVLLDTQWDFEQQKRFHQSDGVVTLPHPLFVKDQSYDVFTERGGVCLKPACVSVDPSSTLIAHMEFMLLKEVSKASEGTKGCKEAEGELRYEYNLREKVLVDGMKFDMKSPLQFYTEGNLLTRDVDLSPGVIQMWVMPEWSDRSQDYYFLDMGEDEHQNRIAFFYEGNSSELVFRVADATFEKRSSEIRWKVNETIFANDVWYHITLCYAGTRYNEIAMLIDGKPVGSYHPKTVLTSSISAEDRNITLKDASILPKSGTIQIGEELISYTGKDGDALLVPEILGRGYGITSKRTHRAGEIVLPYGYSGFLSKTHKQTYLGGGRLTSDIKPGTATHLDKPSSLTDEQKRALLQKYKVHFPYFPPEVRKIFGGIEKDDTTIPVKSTEDFPPSGYLRVGGVHAGEIVHYSQKGSKSFEGVKRGQMGTRATAHVHDCFICLINLNSTTTNNYRSRGMIALGKEIASYKELRAPSYFIARTTWRFKTPHFKGEKIIPVFGVKDARVNCEDEVTLVDVNQRKEPARVGACMGGGDAFVGTKDFLKNIYRYGDRGRMLKFPSGELPSTAQKFLWLGSDRKGDYPAYAVIDEFRIDQFDPPQTVRIAGEIPQKKQPDHIALKTADRWPNVGATKIDDEVFLYEREDTYEKEHPKTRLKLSRTIPAGEDFEMLTVRSTAGFDDSGFIQIGDEVIRYEAKTPASFLRCKGTQMGTPSAGKPSGSDVKALSSIKVLSRAALGTEDAYHGTHTPALVLLPVKVAYLGMDISEKDEALPVVGADNLPEQGFVVIDDEVLLYTANGEGRLTMPVADGAGIFRGRYGTTPAAHKASVPLVLLNVRFEDRNARGSDDPAVHHYQVSAEIPKAFWKNMECEVELAEHHNIRALIRIDGQDTWVPAEEAKEKVEDATGEDTEENAHRDTVEDAKQQAKEIFIECSSVKGINIIERYGRDLDIRFYFEYLPGAFNGNDWKKSPILQKVKIDYVAPNTVHEHYEE